MVFGRGSLALRIYIGSEHCENIAMDCISPLSNLEGGIFDLNSMNNPTHWKHR